VTVRSSEGSSSNLKQLATAAGKPVMAIVQNDMPTDAVVGNQVRSLIPLHMGALHFIVLQDSDIKSLSDLPGRSIAIGTEGSGSMLLVKGLLQHFGIAVEQTVPCTLDQACTKLMAEDVEAILVTSGLKSQKFEVLSGAVPLRLIGLGDGVQQGSEIAGFQLSWPFISRIQIPRFAYRPPTDDQPGVPSEAVPTIGVRAVLLAPVDFPEPIARKITRILSENRSVLIRQNPEASSLMEPGSGETLQYPLHRGALAYLQRNEPGFWHQNAELFGFVMSTIATLVGLLLATRRWILQRQKDRIDLFYQRLGEIWTRVAGDPGHCDQPSRRRKTVG